MHYTEREENHWNYLTMLHATIPVEIIEIIGFIISFLKVVYHCCFYIIFIDCHIIISIGSHVFMVETQRMHYLVGHCSFRPETWKGQTRLDHLLTSLKLYIRDDCSSYTKYNTKEVILISSESFVIHIGCKRCGYLHATRKLHTYLLKTDALTIKSKLTNIKEGSG